MRNFLMRLKHKMLGMRPPNFSSFAANVSDEFRESYRGACADIFFSNDGPTIHKWLHYLPIYDKLFSEYVGTNVRFLEIGVFKGGSLRMWRKLLGTEARIFGVDINPECAKYGDTENQVRIGSQDDPDFLKAVVSEMGGVDIVLDDGSHLARHQRDSFEILFPLLSENGLYIIEDLHTAYWPRFDGGWKRPGTGIEFLKDKIDQMHLPYVKRGMNKKEFMTNIESIQFFDSIAAIRKRAQLPRFHVQSPPAADG